MKFGRPSFTEEVQFKDLHKTRNTKDIKISLELYYWECPGNLIFILKKN